jgi:hypothetical protein
MNRNKLKSFVRLDFVTVRPYFTVKSVLLYAVITAYLTIMSRNISIGISLGLMLSTLFIGYPFAVGEKADMDALYVTLSVSKKTVVAGRYLFMLALNVCCVFVAGAFSAACMLVARILGMDIDGGGGGEFYWAAVLLGVVFFLLQLMHLPIFFKFGYAKAKFFSVMPFAAMMAGFFALTASSPNGNLTSVIGAFVANVLSGGIMLVPVAIALLLALFASYKLSLAFYRRREF